MQTLQDLPFSMALQDSWKCLHQHAQEHTLHALQLQQRGSTVRLCSNLIQDVQWSELYLHGACEQTPEQLPDFTLYHHQDDALYGLVSRELKKHYPITQSFPEVGMHFHDLGMLKAWSYTEQSSVLLTDPAGESMVHLSASNNTAAIHENTRILREWLSRTHENAGCAVFHAGAVRLEEGVVLISGPKGAGKTTSVLSLLSEPEAAFIANDRVYVGSHNHEIHAHGWATTCSIGLGSALAFPALQGCLMAGFPFKFPQFRFSGKHTLRSLQDMPLHAVQRLAEKIELTPLELGQLLGCDITGTGKLRWLIFPHLDLNCSEPEVQTPSREWARARLLAECFTPHDLPYPDWMHLRKGSNTHLQQLVQQLVDQLLDQLPYCTIRYRTPQHLRDAFKHWRNA